MGKSLRLLFIGNSFSDDTMEFLAEIAKSSGYDDIMLGNLYVGACSINMHLRNATENAPVYLYRTNNGEGWKYEPNYSIKEALKSSSWDWVAILSGTGDGSRKTEKESYSRLGELIAYVKSVVGEVKIAYNMAWLGLSTHSHPETVSYGGDIMLMYDKMTAVMRDYVAKTEGVTVVATTGTAIENAIALGLKGIYRDGYHLSMGLGRFIAALCLFAFITGESLNGVTYAPHGLSEEEIRLSKIAAENAVKHPYSITK